MAWANPNYWAQGDNDVGSVNMNKYSDGQNYLYDKVGDTPYVPVTVAGVSNGQYYIVRQKRYLHFISDGSIVTNGGLPDPGTASAAYTLTEVDGTFTRFDLDTTTITYGQLYYVGGVSWCEESDDP